jgi:transposase-like protein
VEWRAIVERFERSGMTATAFCKQIGVTQKTLRYWCWKLRRTSSARATGRSEFLEVRPAAVVSEAVVRPHGRWTIDVIFPDGTTARMGG